MLGLAGRFAGGGGGDIDGDATTTPAEDTDSREEELHATTVVERVLHRQSDQQVAADMMASLRTLSKASSFIDGSLSSWRNGAATTPNREPSEDEKVVANLIASLRTSIEAPSTIGGSSPSSRRNGTAAAESEEERRVGELPPRAGVLGGNRPRVPEEGMRRCELR